MKKGRKRRKVEEEKITEKYKKENTYLNANMHYFLKQINTKKHYNLY